MKAMTNIVKSRSARSGDRHYAMKFDVSDAVLVRIHNAANDSGISREGWVRRSIQDHLAALPIMAVVESSATLRGSNMVICRVSDNDRQLIAEAVADSQLSQVAWLRAVVCQAA